MKVAAGIMISRDSVYAAVSLALSSRVCLILCWFPTYQQIKQSSASSHTWLNFNEVTNLGQIFLFAVRVCLLALTLNTADKTLQFIQENKCLTMHWFPLDRQLKHQNNVHFWSFLTDWMKHKGTNQKQNHLQLSAHVSSSHQWRLF